MRIISDFHIHSRFARATSKNLDVKKLAEGAGLKGLNLIGTGDFTHPVWLKELKESLKEEENGVYSYDNVSFIPTAEVVTIFESGGKTRKVHHLIHAPSFEITEQINEAIGKYGNLKSDGRPILKIEAATLVEKIMDVSKDIFIYPAHAWTPFFGALGSKSGFDSLEDCYQDQVKHIFALETGMSSNPEMNWRLSKLDRFTPISNSDAHSANPWRVGREANVFDLKRPDYWGVVDAIKKRDKKKFLFTIEVEPRYGKYHFDGHRKCNVCLLPKQTKSLNGICPKCKKKLTVGVLNRVEQLADRPEGFRHKDSIDFKTLLPLYEVLSFSIGTGRLYSKKITEMNFRLIMEFGNEFNVLLDVDKGSLNGIAGEKATDAIIRARENKVRYMAGYDGEYGKPVFDDSIEIKNYDMNFQKTLD